MMTETLDDILDDLFHGCAFAAFVEQAALSGGTPCPDRTRRHAYRLYEEALAEKATIQPEERFDHPRRFAVTSNEVNRSNHAD